MEAHEPVELSALDTGHGPVVALVHGGVFHSGPAWAKNIRPIADAGFRVIAVDRRGHGRSSAGDAEKVSVALHAEDLRVTLDALEAQDASLVGVSYGALVCLEFAIKWPAKVERMILLEPPLFTWLGTGHSGYVSQMKRISESARRGAALKDWVPTWLNLIDPRMETQVRPGKPAWKMIERAAHLIFKEEAGWEYDPGKSRVESVSVSTLVLNGAESREELRTVGTLLADSMPNATHRTLEGAGHDAQASAPELFNETVIEFLR